MAYTIENNYTGNGSTRLYSFTFPYLEDTDVKVSLNQVATTNFTLANATQIQFSADDSGETSTQAADGSPKSAVAVRIYRDTDISNLQSEFFSGSAIRAQDLNNDFNQTLYVSQETEKSVEGKWNDSTQTIDSTEAFEDVNTKIMTAAAIDDRIIAKQAARALADGKIIVGNGSGVGAQVTPSGDVTMANTGAFTIANTSVETGMIANDAIDGTKIADNAIDSEHYADGSIDLAHLSSNSVNSAKIVNDSIINEDINSGAAISHSKLANVTGGYILVGNGSNVPTAVEVTGDVTMSNGGAVTIATGAVEHAMLAGDAVDGDNIADDSVNSEHYVDGSIDLAHMSANSVDSDQYVDGSVDHVHLAADCIDGDNIQDDVIDSEHYVAGSIDNEHLADDAVGADELAANAVVNASVAAGAAIAHSKLAAVPDGQIIVGNGSTVPTAVAVSGDVTIANTGAVTIANDAVEIAMIGCEQTTISDSDSHIPTSGAVVDYVSTQLAAIGGFDTIATDAAFPNSQPASGIIVSIADAGGLVVNGSGTSTTGRTVGGSTVTINNINSQFNSTTVAAGVAMMVESTGSSHTYNYHKATLKEADLINLSSDIDDFGNRYRVASSAPGSDNDEGDLYFDTGANKMYVYDGSAWGQVTSTGDYKYLTIKDHDQAVGGSGPTFNGSNEEFDLFDGSADASITSAAQLLVVLNGVLQKPNSGSFDGSEEGFYLNDTHGIKFCDPPASGSTLFVTQIGSATTLQVPADGSVTAAKIGSGAVTTAKIGADAVDATKIADDAVGAEHIEQLDADLSFADSVKAKFGAGNDLNIYHDGSNSYITEEGTGNLKITSSGAGVEIQKSQTEYLGRFLTDGAVELYYDNSKKIETTTNGVTVTGRIDAAADSTHDIGTSSVRFANGYFDTLYGDGSNLTGVAVGGATGTDYNDSVKVRFGTGNDIEIYHDGTDSYIDNATGVTYIRPDGNLQIKDLSSGEVRAAFNNNGAVELYHDGTKQCETTATGLKMQAPSGSNCILEMWADNAENNNDGWQINCEDNNSWNLHSYEDGAWERRLHVGAGDNGAIQMCWVDQADLTSGGIYLANANIASKIYAVSDTTNSLILFVNGNGTVGSIKTVGSATQFNTSSDYRLKENEVPLENAITKLKGLKPYTFNFKKYPDEKVDGFYAHEAAEVVPVAVTGTKDEMAPTYYKEGDTIPSGKHVGDWTGGYSTTEINPQGVDYGKFTPLLTKALQEAIAKIETLEAKVAALEAA